MIFEVESENGGILVQKGLKETTFQDSYYNGINFRIGWKMTGKNDQYHRIYNNPIYGIGVYSSTFNSDIIGSPYAIYGFIQTPLHASKNGRWSYDYRIGLGLSGNFNPYDAVENPYNLVISSKSNVFIDFGIRGQYRFHPKWKAGAGFSFHHFSNGALSLPNKGINLLPLNLSLTYQPKTFVPAPDFPPITAPDHRIIYEASYSAGVKNMSIESKDKYFKSTLGFYASKHAGHKWRLGAGVDIFYSGSGNSREIAGDDAGELGSILSGGPSFYLVHVLDKNLFLSGNMGYYVHKNKFNGERKNIFLRAGVRHYIVGPLNAGVSIKAHTGKADFIEWTLGYTINRKTP